MVWYVLVWVFALLVILGVQLALARTPGERVQAAFVTLAFAITLPFIALPTVARFGPSPMDYALILLPVLMFLIGGWIVAARRASSSGQGDEPSES
jgi:uncharacterized membrane protein YjdF